MSLHQLDGMAVMLVSPEKCCRHYSAGADINLSLVYAMLGFFPLCDACYLTLQAELIIKEHQT